MLSRLGMRQYLYAMSNGKVRPSITSLCLIGISPRHFVSAWTWMLPRRKSHRIAAQGMERLRPKAALLHNLGPIELCTFLGELKDPIQLASGLSGEGLIMYK